MTPAAPSYTQESTPFRHLLSPATRSRTSCSTARATAYQSGPKRHSCASATAVARRRTTRGLVPSAAPSASSAGSVRVSAVTAEPAAYARTSSGPSRPVRSASGQRWPKATRLSTPAAKAAEVEAEEAAVESEDAAEAAEAEHGGPMR